MKPLDGKGYTLMELVVAVFIAGILASFAVPQYLRTIENGKFDDATGLVNQIGMTNRMFALDHQGAYVAGAFTGASCACTASTCSGYSIAPNTPYTKAGGCPLVCCNYLGDQNWSGKPYEFFACDPASANCGGGCGAFANPSPVSCASRATSGSSGTSLSPYNKWGLWMNVTGTIAQYPAAGNANAAPNPTF